MDMSVEPSGTLPQLQFPATFQFPDPPDHVFVVQGIETERRVTSALVQLPELMA
jgi:hypothetical protein